MLPLLCLPLLLLIQFTASAGESTSPTPEAVRAAITRATPLLQSSADTWYRRRSCSSCHHQSLGILAASVVREQGLVADVPRLHVQVRRTMSTVNNWQEKVVVNELSINEAIGQSYRAIGAAAAGYPATEVTAGIVHAISGRQHVSGRWSSNSRRPPLEDGDFTATALSLRAIQLYPIADRKAELLRRIAAAREWLLASEPASTEDRAMQLLGVAWANGDGLPLTQAASTLLGEQAADGGWRQVPTRAPDAYATGEALVALHQAGGISMRDPRMQQGIAWLLRHQKPDGSWHVPTMRTNSEGLPYFESGYPHGADQFISYAGAAWATMALALSLTDTRSEVLMGSPQRTVPPNGARLTDGLTPLMRAALHGTVADVRALLRRGASLNDTSPMGITVLMAAAHDSAKTALLLASGAGASAMLNRTTRDGHSALQLAASTTGANGAARLLLASGANVQTAVHESNAVRGGALVYALIRGDTSLADELFRRGAAVNSDSAAIESPLMIAAWYGDADMATWLLARGARVDDGSRMLHGDSVPSEPTPLMLAATDGQLEVLRVLLVHGANVHATDGEGFTALHHAASGPDRGSLDVIEALLRAGARAERLTLKGESAAMLARRFRKPYMADRLGTGAP